MTWLQRISPTILVIMLLSVLMYLTTILATDGLVIRFAEQPTYCNQLPTGVEVARHIGCSDSLDRRLLGEHWPSIVRESHSDPGNPLADSRNLHTESSHDSDGGQVESHPDSDKPQSKITLDSRNGPTHSTYDSGHLSSESHPDSRNGQAESLFDSSNHQPESHTNVSKPQPSINGQQPEVTS